MEEREGKSFREAHGIGIQFNFLTHIYIDIFPGNLLFLYPHFKKCKVSNQRYVQLLKVRVRERVGLDGWFQGWLLLDDIVPLSPLLYLACTITSKTVPRRAGSKELSLEKFYILNIDG